MKVRNLKYLLYAAFILLLISNQALCQLSVHGYLTQAYAFSKNHQIFGIPKSGTSDLRNLALQFRYDINDQNNIIIQFSHERMGLSPLIKLKNDVELDWAFFEHRFNEQTSIRVGKILLPFGIYNEIRDVGTLLPFYRLPYGPYGNGNYMSETLDGLSVNQQLNFFSDWQLSVDLYGGQWTWIEWFSITNPLTKGIEYLTETADIKRGGGVRLILYTPLEQTSISVGIQHGHVSGGLSFEKKDWLGEQNFTIYHSSVNAEFQRLFFKGELFYISFQKIPTFVTANFLQAGVSLTDQLIFVSQYEYFGLFDTRINPESFYTFGAYEGSFDYNRGFALAMNYKFSSNIVLKIENHWNKSFLLEDKSFLLLIDDPVNTMHTILSISTSF